MSAEQEHDVRRYAFVAAIGAFVTSYIVTLLRTGSLEWAILASSLILVLMIGASLFVTSFILVTLVDNDKAESRPEAPSATTTATKGGAVDLTLQEEDHDEIE